MFAVSVSVPDAFFSLVNVHTTHFFVSFAIEMLFSHHFLFPCATSQHLDSSFANIRSAKDAIVRLIIGSPPGKVHTQMKNEAARNKTRF